MTAPEQDRTIWSTWRKSSFSGGGTGNCVQIAWRRSSFSGGSAGSNCVEVAFVVEAVAVRDSKNPDGPHLEFPHTHWRRFLG
ncbi:MAG TPA: DUF397 domain-containing protein [Actinophytocola sp.]|uniref:DUF397 domain-containing protein n=1 Tax=Actinophytocola sp. TaxID=1872138 RepID=UPI002DDD5DBF|nr:DUF397 domain-containing protein [Actinophytocola sp.]HEV2784472.1 DUF397 domain-containing protein [Actinophytocola sp.]